MFSIFSDPNLTYLQDEFIQRINQLPQPFFCSADSKTSDSGERAGKPLLACFGDYPPVLQDLNFVRDCRWQIRCSTRCCFCLPSYAINRVMKYAPDFWSWKSGVFRILANQNQQDEASIYALHAQKMLGATSQLERQERIKLLEKLAQEFDPLRRKSQQSRPFALPLKHLVTLGSIYVLSGGFF